MTPVSRYLDVLERAPTLRKLRVEGDTGRSNEKEAKADCSSKDVNDTTKRLFGPLTDSGSESDEEEKLRLTNTDRLREPKPITREETEISTKTAARKARPGLDKESLSFSPKLIDDIFDSLRGGREGPRTKLASKNDPEEPEGFRREKFVESEEELDDVEKPNFRAFNDDDDEINVIPMLQTNNEEDEETSEKVSSSGSVGYRYANDFFAQQENPDNGTVQSQNILTRCEC